MGIPFLHLQSGVLLLRCAFYCTCCRALAHSRGGVPLVHACLLQNMRALGSLTSPQDDMAILSSISGKFLLHPDDDWVSLGIHSVSPRKADASAPQAVWALLGPRQPRMAEESTRTELGSVCRCSQLMPAADVLVIS